MSSARFNLPDLGEGLQEAEIVRWHVAIGDVVKVDDPLVAVETAKAVVEVPAPQGGRIEALHGKPGDTVAVGAALVDFAAEGKAAPATASGTVVGHMPVSDEEIAAAPQRRSSTGAAGVRPRAVPAARDLARRLGVDVSTLTGTGREGLVTVDDVMAAGVPPVARTQSPALGASSSMRPAPALGEDGGELEVLRSLRRAMAQSMSLARDNVMECTVSDDADIEGWQSGADYTVRQLRAIAAGCNAEPGLNAWFDATAQGRRVFHHIDVG
ncbi:MAG: biotin/lipoyl-containing protein, partial [Steroidobacteraceae bacterium]